jgi:hypothetical protein
VFCVNPFISCQAKSAVVASAKPEYRRVRYAVIARSDAGI